MFVALRRIIRSGAGKFVRDRSSTWAAIVVMLIVISMATSLVFLQGFSVYIVDSIEQRIAISTYLEESASEEEIMAMQDEIEGIPQVREVEYIPRDEALERFQDRHSDDELVLRSIEAVGENPLLASLSIKADDPEHYPSIVQALEQSTYASIINNIDYHNRAPIIERVAQLNAAIRIGVAAVSAVLAVIAVLVVFNTIRLTIYNSRDEIDIMKLVGASNWFIHGPFIFQGILSGLVATAIAMAVLAPLAYFSAPHMESLAPGFHIWAYFLNNFILILGIQLAVGVGLGMISSTIAIRRHLAI